MTGCGRSSILDCIHITQLEHRLSMKAVQVFQRL